MLKRVASVAEQAVKFADLRNLVKDDPRAMRKEPMFCMELGVRLFYWARMAYQYNVEGTMQTEEYAKNLFNLESFECIHDEQIDTKMVMGWSNDTMVIAFRGTASKKNVVTDLKLFSRPYPGQHWRHGLSVRVHSGFYQAWSENNYRETVMQRVTDIITSSTTAGRFKVYVTGHSLGGALAVLASLEVKKQNPAAEVVCYTFGAPRVGNISFASLCDASFESWHIINEDDPVPRVPPGFLLYRRCGQQVIMTTRGDCIVRPGYFELLLFKKNGDVKDHMMGNYALAMASIIRAQFFPHKALLGGERSARELMKAVDVGATLLITPFNIEEVSDPLNQIKMRAMVSKLDGDALTAALSSVGYNVPDTIEEGDEENFIDCVEDFPESPLSSSKPPSLAEMASSEKADSSKDDSIVGENNV